MYRILCQNHIFFTHYMTLYTGRHGTVWDLYNTMHEWHNKYRLAYELFGEFYGDRQLQFSWEIPIEWAIELYHFVAIILFKIGIHFNSVWSMSFSTTNLATSLKITTLHIHWFLSVSVKENIISLFCRNNSATQLLYVFEQIWLSEHFQLQN